MRASWRSRAGAVVFGCASFATPLIARAQDSVWVNTRSGVYHCPGSDAFGTTTKGHFLPESIAVARGFRARGGLACAPPRSVVLTPPDSARETLEPLVPREVDAPSRPAGPTEPCTLVRIADGDTFHCSNQRTVRLIGSDAPERGQEPYVAAATAGLAAMVPIGATLQLERDRRPRDKYGRLLAYAWYDGRLLNWAMVREGWSVTLRYAPNVRYADQLDRAEVRARTERRGLWSVDGFRCRPKAFRARAC
jgi:micrococcal nuclease